MSAAPARQQQQQTSVPSAAMSGLTLQPQQQQQQRASATSPVPSGYSNAHQDLLSQIFSAPAPPAVQQQQQNQFPAHSSAFGSSAPIAFTNTASSLPVAPVQQQFFGAQPQPVLAPAPPVAASSAMPMIITSAKAAAAVSTPPIKAFDKGGLQVSSTCV